MDAGADVAILKGGYQQRIKVGEVQTICLHSNALFGIDRPKKGGSNPK